MSDKVSSQSSSGTNQSYGRTAQDSTTEHVPLHPDRAASDSGSSVAGKSAMDLKPTISDPQTALHVRDVMTAHVETIHPDNTLEQAAHKMKQCDIHPLPVCEGDEIIGMLTDRDIVMRSVAHGEDPTVDRVRDIMTAEGIAYCFEDQDIQEAARIMGEKQVHQLPVLDRDKKLVGIVSILDLGRPNDV